MHNFKVNDFHREKPRGWKGSKSVGLFLFGSRHAQEEVSLLLKREGLKNFGVMSSPGGL